MKGFPKDWLDFTRIHALVDEKGTLLERLYDSFGGAPDPGRAMGVLTDYLDLVGDALSRSSRDAERALAGTPEGMRLAAEDLRIRALSAEVRDLLSSAGTTGGLDLLRNRVRLLVRSVRQHLICFELDLFDRTQQTGVPLGALDPQIERIAL